MPRRPQLLANGYLTTLGDGLLDIAMVVVGGGFDSPFYFILFTVTDRRRDALRLRSLAGRALLYVAADGAGHVIEHPCSTARSSFARCCCRSRLSSRATCASRLSRPKPRFRNAAPIERAQRSNRRAGREPRARSRLTRRRGRRSSTLGSPTAVLQPTSGLDGDASSLPAAIYYPSTDH